MLFQLVKKLVKLSMHLCMCLPSYLHEHVDTTQLTFTVKLITQAEPYSTARRPTVPPPQPPVNVTSVSKTKINRRYTLYRVPTYLRITY